MVGQEPDLDGTAVVGDMITVAVEELLWTYHPLDPSWAVMPLKNNDEQLDQADVFVQTNIIGSKKAKHQAAYRYIVYSGKPWVVSESAVFRKNQPVPPHPDAYHRYSWFSYFQDEGEYCNSNSPSDRWNQVQSDQGIDVKPWRHSGDYVLLILQKPYDSSLTRLMSKHGSYTAFISDTLSNIQQHTDRKIRIRLHPLRQKEQLDAIRDSAVDFDQIEISDNLSGATGLEGGAGLYRDFAGAAAVIGFNSNALTESACEGVPTYSLCSSSMAWPVNAGSLDQLENPNLRIDRTQWLYDLAYCQWKESEVLSGAMWEHLRQAWPKIAQTRLERPDWADIEKEKQYMATLDKKQLRKYLKNQKDPRLI